MGKMFLRGIFTLLPITVSIYFLFLFFDWAEHIVRNLLVVAFGQANYVPGMGLVLGLGLILFLGFLMGSPLAQSMYQAIERPILSVPIVKSIYLAVKDLTEYFGPKSENSSHQVVSVSIPNLDIQLVGFITRDNLDTMPEGMNKLDRVAVYLPMSYQIGGYTLFVPRAWTTPLNMKVEQAMRSALPGWMPGKK